MYIKTKRLVLKPMSAADVPVLAELLADEVVKRTYMVPDLHEGAGTTGSLNRP